MVVSAINPIPVGKLIFESKKITENLWLHQCNRCRHEWPSKLEKPNTCANKKCRSPYWNKPRKRHTIRIMRKMGVSYNTLKNMIKVGGKL